MMLKFSDCTLDDLDQRFSLIQVDQSQTLDNWLIGEAEISEVERTVLTMYQQMLSIHSYDWNEAELLQHFIGPMFALVNFSNKQFSIFSQRNLTGVVEGIEMGGNPDGLIASGWRSPKRPFFCLQEYKKQLDLKGDPAGQCLAAMLVAQELNDHQHPIYGCYVMGKYWNFMTLEAKDYCISESYIGTDDEIFDIFRILKVLKQTIVQLMAMNHA